MTQTYTMITNLANSLHNEVVDVSNQNEKLTDDNLNIKLVNKVLVIENIRLVTLIDILEKQIERSKLH